jgi:hypothetical protein
VRGVSATPQREPSRSELLQSLNDRLRRLQAASVTLREISDSLHRDGSTTSLADFLDDLTRELALVQRDADRIRAGLRH